MYFQCFNIDTLFVQTKMKLIVKIYKLLRIRYKPDTKIFKFKLI